MPRITSGSSIGWTTDEIQDEPPASSPSLLATTEDRFEAGCQAWWGRCNVEAPKWFVEEDLEHYTRAKERLCNNGIVAVSAFGGQVLPSIDHLSKLRELISKSDEPRYFFMEIGKDNQIKSITSFKSKTDWMKSVEVNKSPSSIDKKSQLECIDELCAPEPFPDA